MALKTELLGNSFALLCDKQEEFTQYFYQTLFTDYPEVRPLFAHTDMAEQPKKLFKALTLTVNNLTKPDTLSSALKGMGTRHVKYGVFPAHYPMVGNTLIKSMAAMLPDEWTSEMEVAWAEAYAAITALMLEGADYSQQILEIAVEKAPQPSDSEARVLNFS